uniref:Ig-like domain-containing protein n=1 Tax=Kryptolebias marmoratus TaxID=37003 RepID=A0A3Q3BAK0_KRYMA
MSLSLGLTATPEGLSVGQYPPSLTVMRGETATLGCHFKVESLKYGVQWFKMKPGKQLIPKSSRQIFVEKNQSSSLVIPEVTLEDSGWYYCEVNVLQKDPQRGNGTELCVLGEKQIGGFRNEHARSSLNFSGPLTCRAGFFLISTLMQQPITVFQETQNEIGEEIKTGLLVFRVAHFSRPTFDKQLHTNSSPETSPENRF